MNKSITFTFTFRNYNKVKDSDVYQPLILRLLPFGKQSKTPFKIPPKHWDKDKQEIKPRFREVHNTLIKELNILKDKLSEYPRKIKSGELYPDNVLDEVLGNKQVIDTDKSVVQLISDTPAQWGEAKILTHIQNVRGVEKWLKHHGSRIKEIKLSMLNDNRIIDEISLALRNSSLAKSTISGYMATLDRVTQVAELNNHRPFKNRQLKPKNIASRPRHRVEESNLQLGINKIKTYKDLEAYLWFLYGYCLQGLDFVDIANLDENAIYNHKGEKITHYYPFGDFIESETSKVLTQKWYVKGDIKRSKSEVQISCLVNLFPTLFIRDWLLWVMKITSPDIAYNGSDRLRIFKYKTRDKNFKRLPDNYKKIKSYYTAPSRKMKELFGVSYQLTRHSFTQIGKQFLGLTGDQMDMQLNHSMKGSLDSYVKGENAQDMRDIRHNQLINLLGVSKVLHLLYTKVRDDYKGGKLCWYKKSKAIPGKHPSPAKLVTNDMLIGWALLDHDISSEWTTDLAKEFTQIRLEYSRPRPEYVNGEIVLIQREESEYPKRYRELNEIRKKAFGDFPISINKNGGIKVEDSIMKERLQEIKNLDKVNEIIKKG
jgi:hypothetical protein